MDFGTFINNCCAHPWSFVALILALGVTFINGWTDAPNAIATAVGTRAMTPKQGVILATICNLLGVLFIGFCSSFIGIGDVAQTVASLVSYNLADTGMIEDALIAVSFALVSIIVWSTGSTLFGLPSSESNELVGGIIGGGMALSALRGSNWFAGVKWAGFGQVMIGFFVSLFVGFVLGWALVKLIEFVCRNMRRGPTTRFFSRGEVVASGFTAFIHGVQDGAKFIGVIILIAAITQGSQDSSSLAGLNGTWWIVLPVGLLMTIGTSCGGYSIIKTMGEGMVKLQKHQGFATDIASTIGLLMATVLGWPVSTGSVKTTAILGAGAARGFKKVKWGKALTMVGSWLAIFPACALIGFIFTAIFAAIF